jgi:hypothetical protein
MTPTYEPKSEPTLYKSPTTFFYAPFWFNVIADAYWFYPA